MTKPNVEKHELPIGELSFEAKEGKPLVYYTGKAGSRGILNMKLENEGREYIIIPVDQEKYMTETTKANIIQKLNSAQSLINDAYNVLNEVDLDKCEYFANLSCNIDEALAEIDNL